MYDPTRVRDHIAKGLAKLLEQFQEKPVIEALLSSYLAQIQKLEDAAWEVITIRGIELSEGVGLDAIGNIVGRKRLGLEDSDYRIALRGQIRINRSAGTTVDLIDVTDLSLPSGFSGTYDEEYPAAVYVGVVEQITFSIFVLFDNLIKTKLAGVRLFLFYTPDPVDSLFQFSSTNDTETDDLTGFGWGDFDPDKGGKLISLLVK